MTATKKKADVWMPLYISDYVSATMHLNTEQHGAYLLLLMAAWKSGGRLPSDASQLASICRLPPERWAAHEGVLAQFFFVTEDFWIHNRVRREIEKAVKNTEAKAKSGAKGGSAKWGSDIGFMPDEPTRFSASALRSERLANARKIATHTELEWVALRDALGSCVRCQAEGPLVKDHITPIYQGGSDGIDNLQPLCRKCNSSKGAEAVDHRPYNWRDLADEWLAKRLANA